MTSILEEESLTKKVTTATGSVYLVDYENRFWKKNNEPTERLWFLQQSAVPASEIEYPWVNRDKWEDVEVPEIGKHMYIASRDVWYISTEVVSVEDVKWQ